jgi:phospholipid-binding lipoprotein MlaA
MATLSKFAHHTHSKLRLVCVLLLLLISGCASTSSVDGEPHPNDPLEPFNRAMWAFNYDFLDPYLVRPVSLTYGYVMPDFARSGVSNFLANLDEPASVVNNLIMGNGDLALLHLNRFWVNTTFGVAGLMDVASRGGLVKEEERVFSDAIGHYGVGNGWFLMIPAYGPLTTREVTDYADNLYPPLSYLNFWASFGKWLLEGVETRIELVEQESLIENSPDPYALTREVYLQRRDYRADLAQETVVDEESEAELDAYLDEL